MPLKPQDVLLALHLALHAEETWTYGTLQESLSISVGELHNAIGRLKAARLLLDGPSLGSRVRRFALEEFVIHGVKYAFAARRGARTRGVPTGVGASPLKQLLADSSGDLPVWPHPQGTVWGDELSPLYKTVPDVALRDPKLYEVLALLDTIRGGAATAPRRLAHELLRERLRAAGGAI